MDPFDLPASPLSPRPPAAPGMQRPGGGSLIDAAKSWWYGWTPGDAFSWFEQPNTVDRTEDQIRANQEIEGRRSLRERRMAAAPPPATPEAQPTQATEAATTAKPAPSAPRPGRGAPAGQLGEMVGPPEATSIDLLRKELDVLRERYQQFNPDFETVTPEHDQVVYSLQRRLDERMRSYEDQRKWNAVAMFFAQIGGDENQVRLIQRQNELNFEEMDALEKQLYMTKMDRGRVQQRAMEQAEEFERQKFMGMLEMEQRRLEQELAFQRQMEGNRQEAGLEYKVRSRLGQEEAGQRASLESQRHGYNLEEIREQGKVREESSEDKDAAREREAIRRLVGSVKSPEDALRRADMLETEAEQDAAAGDLRSAEFKQDMAAILRERAGGSGPPT